MFARLRLSHLAAFPVKYKMLAAHVCFMHQRLEVLAALFQLRVSRLYGLLVSLSEYFFCSW